MQFNALNDEKLSQLGHFLWLTRPEELTCDEWLDRVTSYADAVAAGLPPPPDSELVQHHLAICTECREEFEAIVAGLRSQ